jgi:hypothetical protein
MISQTPKPELTPEVSAMANRASTAAFKLVASFLAVNLTDIALTTGWGITLPIFPVWGLLVIGVLVLGYISRAVSYNWSKGQFTFISEKISQSGPIGAPQAPEFPGTVYPNPQAQSGPYL